MAAKRVQIELKALNKSKDLEKCDIHVEPVDGNHTELKGEVTGPPDTPYEGGKFTLEIKIPERYPFNPPEVRFVTRIWQPNISSLTGKICLDILSTKWSPLMTLRTMLLSIQALMASPEPDDPLDGTVSRQYNENPEMFTLTARQRTAVCADGPNGNNDCYSKVRVLKDMGVDGHAALNTLSIFNWDLVRAKKEFPRKRGTKRRYDQRHR